MQKAQPAVPGSRRASPEAAHSSMAEQGRSQPPAEGPPNTPVADGQPKASDVEPKETRRAPRTASREDALKGAPDGRRQKQTDAQSEARGARFAKGRTEVAGSAGPAAADAAPPPADPATPPMDVDEVPPLQQAAGGGAVEQGFGTQDTGALGGGEAPLASDAASVPPPAPSVEPATSIGASELQDAAMGFCPKEWKRRVPLEKCTQYLEKLVKSLEDQPVGYVQALDSKDRDSEDRVPVYKGTPTTFGYYETNQVIIKSESAKRYHAEVVVVETQVMLAPRRDANIRDTILLRGERLQRKEALRDGDEFVICGKKFRFDEAEVKRNYGFSMLRGNRRKHLGLLYSGSSPVDDGNAVERRRDVRYMGQSPRKVLFKLLSRVVLRRKARAKALRAEAEIHSLFVHQICRELLELIWSSSEKRKLEPAEALAMLEALPSKPPSVEEEEEEHPLYSAALEGYNKHYEDDPDRAKLRRSLRNACKEYDGADTVSEIKQLSLPRRRRDVLRAGMDTGRTLSREDLSSMLLKKMVPDGVRGALYTAFVLSHRVDLHAIDATPA